MEFIFNLSSKNLTIGVAINEIIHPITNGIKGASDNLRHFLMTAFFLEIFLGFGAGHFYSGNTTTGVAKLIIYLCLLISIIAICVYRMKITDTERENSFIFRFLKSICFLVCGFTYLGWQMIDSILFTLEEFTDQNGQPLYH